MKKIQILALFAFLFAAIFIVSCSNENEVPPREWTRTIKGTQLDSIKGVSVGLYYQQTSNPGEENDMYYECIYLPFPEQDKSYACAANLSNAVKDGIPLLRLKSSTVDVVYCPVNKVKYSNAEFNLMTGLSQNDEAKGMKILSYNVERLVEKKKDSQGKDIEEISYRLTSIIRD